MNIKSKRFAILLLTLVFSVSVFTVAAFAEGEVTPVSDAPILTSSEPAPPSSAATETSSAPAGENSSSSSGKEVSSHSSSRTPASSHKDTTSSKQKVQIPNRAIDTQTHRVEATASQAAQAVSDPDVLSSENWGQLLSSGEQTQSQKETAGAMAVSSTAPPKGIGGVSWIFILGVVLIMLSLCGFGLFVYLQFFSDDRGGRGGPRGLKSNSADVPDEENSEEPLTFTDISSASDGKQHRGDYVPGDTQGTKDIRSISSAVVAKSGVKPETVKKTPVKNAENTPPIVRETIPNRKPAVPTAKVESAAKSQATPVSNGSDFDWEKFFNEQE